ncbi:MAG: uncharacterized protein KVP18_004852 [Porospora cf. gigantea A]|uniref:uncharacterized protein n=1 Tax=Porospora cf. gigantea A TaxID=2853593 RepID=UPI00355A24ED|nr:MAG: hypothetical protein KVP18_004852 [Porospora cf. gigantea A]
MGVKLLLSTIKRAQNYTCSEVDFWPCERGPRVLLVDFYGFLFKMRELISTLHPAGLPKNSLCELSSFDLETVSHVVSAFVVVMRFANWEVEFVKDGKSISGSWMESYARIDTWLGRERQYLNSWKNIWSCPKKRHDVLKEETSMKLLPTWVAQTVKVLSLDMGCLVWHTKGEADPFIGKVLRDRGNAPQVTAVLSCDTDFAVIKGSRLLLLQDMLGVLGPSIVALVTADTSIDLLKEYRSPHDRVDPTPHEQWCDSFLDSLWGRPRPTVRFQLHTPSSIGRLLGVSPDLPTTEFHRSLLCRITSMGTDYNKRGSVPNEISDLIIRNLYRLDDDFVGITPFDDSSAEWKDYQIVLELYWRRRNRRPQWYWGFLQDVYSTAGLGHVLPRLCPFTSGVVAMDPPRGLRCGLEEFRGQQQDLDVLDLQRLDFFQRVTGRTTAEEVYFRSFPPVRAEAYEVFRAYHLSAVRIYRNSTKTKAASVAFVQVDATGLSLEALATPTVRETVPVLRTSCDIFHYFSKGFQGLMEHLSAPEFVTLAVDQALYVSVSFAAERLVSNRPDWGRWPDRLGLEQNIDVEACRRLRLKAASIDYVVALYQDYHLLMNSLQMCYLAMVSLVATSLHEQGNIWGGIRRFHKLLASDVVVPAKLIALLAVLQLEDATIGTTLSNSCVVQDKLGHKFLVGPCARSLFTKIPVRQ